LLTKLQTHTHITARAQCTYLQLSGLVNQLGLFRLVYGCSSINGWLYMYTHSLLSPYWPIYILETVEFL